MQDPRIWLESRLWWCPAVWLISSSHAKRCWAKLTGLPAKKEWRDLLNNFYNDAKISWYWTGAFWRLLRDTPRTSIETERFILHARDHKATVQYCCQCDVSFLSINLYLISIMKETTSIPLIPLETFLSLSLTEITLHRKEIERTSLFFVLEDVSRFQQSLTSNVYWQEKSRGLSFPSRCSRRRWLIEALDQKLILIRNKDVYIFLLYQKLLSFVAFVISFLKPFFFRQMPPPLRRLSHWSSWVSAIYCSMSSLAGR